MKRTLFFRSVFAAALLLTLTGAATAGTEVEYFNRTLTVNGKADIEVMSGSGEIRIRAVKGNTVSIKARVEASDGWFRGSLSAREKVRRIVENPPIEQNGNNIVIGKIRDRELSRNVSISYELTVPEDADVRASSGSGDVVISGIQGYLKSSTGSGEVRADNIKGGASLSSGSGNITADTIQGNLKVSTGSGDVTARSLGGAFTVRTGSGNVRIEQNSAGSGDASTGSGDIRVDGLIGGMRASTGSGNIEIAGKVTESWRISTGSGDITLNVPAGSDFDIDVESRHGSVRLGSLKVDGIVKSEYAKGRIGKGGAMVFASTGSGNVIIR